MQVESDILKSLISGCDDHLLLCKFYLLAHLLGNSQMFLVETLCFLPGLCRHLPVLQASTRTATWKSIGLQQKIKRFVAPKAQIATTFTGMWENHISLSHLSERDFHFLQKHRKWCVMQEIFLRDAFGKTAYHQLMQLLRVESLDVDHLSRAGWILSVPSQKVSHPGLCYFHFGWCPDVFGDSGLLPPSKLFPLLLRERKQIHEAMYAKTCSLIRHSPSMAWWIFLNQTSQEGLLLLGWHLFHLAFCVH